MIDKNKQYRTRDGREVRIYATDGGGIQPIHGAIREGEQWEPQMWDADGRYIHNGSQANADLVECKPRIKRVVYINVHKTVSGFYETLSYTPQSKSQHTDLFAVTRFEHDFEEGEGL